MKQTFRFTALFLSAAILIGSFTGTAAFAADSTGDFSIDSQGVLTKYNGAGGDVVIPDGVTSIGQDAFNNSAVTSVTIPEGVTTIGISAFGWCQNLSRVVIPDSVITIGQNAFINSAISSVTIPEGVTTIGIYAFGWCGNLSSVVIPDSVTDIGTGAFSDSGLTSVTLPKGLKVIQNSVFFKTKLTRIEIPQSVVTIGDRAFADCTSLADVTVPETLTDFQPGAFENTAFKNNNPSPFFVINGVLLNYKGTDASVTLPPRCAHHRLFGFCRHYDFSPPDRSRGRDGNSRLCVPIQ